MAGISDKALKGNYAENKYRFNDGTELANKEFSDGGGLEMYETPFRNYDPQLGIFHQIDPLADIMADESPYAFALNNPISYNDAWGLAPNDSTKPNSPGADVPLMPEAIVTAKKKDCVTCDPITFNLPPPPSSVAAPIKGNSAKTAAMALTVTTLGEGAGGGITITGGGLSLPLLLAGGSFYGMYSVSQMHLPAPILNVPNSDIPRFAPAVALPGYVGGQPAQHAYHYATEPWGEQYTLRAQVDGLYPIYQWGKGQIGMKHLSRGDIWKIGTTINGASGRGYSTNYLNNTGAGLMYVPEFIGPVDQLIFVERMKLLNYVMQNGGNLPPGNTKLQ